jgi:hypothetical protein
MQNKTKYTIREATEFLGFGSRSTLNSKTKDGTLSWEKDNNGTKVIDASELARVFPDEFNRAVSNTNNVQYSGNKKAQENTPSSGPDNIAVINMLTQQVDLMKEYLHQQTEQNKERETRLYTEKAELLSVIKNQTLMLTHQPNNTEDKRKTTREKYKSTAIISTIIAGVVLSTIAALYILAHFLK